MKPASLYFEILKGGPFDGLPALCLRLEDEGEELDLGAIIQIVSNMSPPPMHFRVLYVAGEVEDASMLRLLQLVSSYGMGTSVEIFGPFFSWMLQFGWRCLHTSDLCIVHPVEEIVFHTEEIPRFHPFPFHAVKPPLLWWAPPRGRDDIFEVLPQNMRLWSFRKTPSKRIFPKEEI